ncbi:MAG TPA: class I SAM-dependent methyltransferase [Allosphingosinicella sp.]|nr:class I SAM-dependent methyltransferase [Allosphingosinicella sp.]
MRLASKVGRLVRREAGSTNLGEYWVPNADARVLKDDYRTDLARIFFENEGRVIHKWLHYFEIYERYLSRYRGSDFKMLEIGVSKGGSLAMWRTYFGPNATIFGIDVNPDCAGRAEAPNQVRIGSQDDPDFLRRVVAEMGGVDFVLDDGSHVARHQQASFETLFPLLADGGLYAIEDLHTAYWPDYGGGYGRRGSAIELLKQSVDDIHHWYHRRPPAFGGADVGAVHFHDSIAVVEKRKALRPIHTQMGCEEDLLNPADI